MLLNCSLFVAAENETEFASVDSNDNFTVREVMWMPDKQSNNYLYQQLVFKVSRKPKLLISHLQRIYFTYNQGMSEQLYAALIDLLWVLDGKGRDLSRRMVSSSLSFLSEQQVKALDKCLKQQNSSLLTGNRYSVLAMGLKGTREVLTGQSNVQATYDPLDIARDYIQYSQLDAALNTLEVAVLETPEREDLQTELLELYKVTENIQAFTKMQNSITEKQMSLSVKWQEMADYFAGLSNEE